MGQQKAETPNARKLRRRDRAAIARLRKDIHVLKERLELLTLKSIHPPLPVLPPPPQPGRNDRPAQST